MNLRNSAAGDWGETGNVVLTWEWVMAKFKSGPFVCIF